MSALHTFAGTTNAVGGLGYSFFDFGVNEALLASQA
jgi:hypothetical protein